MTGDGGQKLLKQVLEDARARLTQAGVPAPALDVRVLAMEAFGLDHAGLIAASGAEVGGVQFGGAALKHFEAALARRASGEPVARIIGRREFFGRDFTITPATLDPRPETEILVDWALALARQSDEHGRGLKLLDIGTGSGAIAVSLLAELPALKAVASDIRPDALAVARQNAAHHGVEGRFFPVCCDWAGAISGVFDLVVSNPPYIASGEISALEREVREHDPLLALDGGEDGLAAYRAIAADALRLLKPGGWLLVEIGAGQKQGVCRFLRAAGTARMVPHLAWRKDLAGHIRVIAMQKRVGKRDAKG